MEADRQPAPAGEAELAPGLRPGRAPKAPRPLWRRALRLLLRVILGLLALIVTILLLVLFTQAGTRLALNTGARVYDGMIPGRVEIGKIEGALADRLVISGVALEDSTGTRLVELERLALGLDLGRALRGNLTLGSVELEGARIFVPGPDVPGFADLAPPRDPDAPPPPPPDPEAGLGPDLPATIDLELHLRRVLLERAPSPPRGLAALAEADPDPAPEVMLDLDHLDLSAHGAGRSATLELDLAARVPAVSDLDVEELHIAARWDEPRATLEQLRLSSNWASLELGPLELDLDAIRGSLDELRAQAEEEWFTSMTTLPTDGPPTVELAARGGAPELTAELSANVPGTASAELEVSAALEPELRVDLDLRSSAELARLSPALDPGELSLETRVSLAGDPEEELRLRAQIECLDCDPRTPVRLELSADGSPAARTGSARLDLNAAGATVNATASADASGQLELNATIDAPKLSRVARLVDRFVARPELVGRARLELRCAGALEPRDITCRIKSDVGQIPPLERAALDLHATLKGDQLHAELRRLRAAAFGLQTYAETQEGPAIVDVALDRGAVKVQRLALALGEAVAASAEGQPADNKSVTPAPPKLRAPARISIDGAYDPKGTNDLRVGVNDLQLALANKFAPTLRASGRAELDVHLHGPAKAPRAAVTVRGRELAVLGEAVGQLDLTAGYEPGVARAELELRDGPIDALTLRAAIPFTANLATSRFALTRGPLSTTLSLRGAQLPKLLAFAGPEDQRPPLAGSLDVELALAGSARRPTLELDVHGRELRFAEKALGTLRVLAGYDREGATAQIQLDHPKIRRLAVDAEVPLRAALAPSPGASWLAQKRHQLHVDIDGVDLALVRDWAPDVALSGTTDLDVVVDGPITRALTAQLELGVDALTYDEKSIGDLLTRVDYREGEVELTLDASSPMARTVALTARAPIGLDPRRGRVDWEHDKPHELRLGLAGAELAALAPWVDGLPALGGRAWIDLSVTGTALAPTLQLDGGVDKLSLEKARVAELGLHADYKPGAANVGLVARRDGVRSVELSAHAPVTVDAVAGGVDWDREGMHALALTVRNLDPDFVAAIKPLPPELDFLLGLELNASGGASDFELAAALTGHVGADDTRYPLRGQIAVDPRAQRLNLLLKAPYKNRDERAAPTPVLDLDAASELDLLALQSGALDPLAAPLRLRLDVDALNLKPASGFLPTSLYDLVGALSADLDASGTIGAPALSGTATVADAGVTVVPLRQRFQDVDVELAFSSAGSEITAALKRLSIATGRGSIDATGQAAVVLPHGDVDAGVEIAIDDLPLRQPGLPRMKIDSKITSAATVDARGVNVDIAIAETLVDVQPTNVAAPKRIPTSDRVTYVELVDEEALPDLPKATAQTGNAPGEPGAPTRVAVKLVDPLRIRGPSIDMSWGGEVEVAITDAVSAKGALENDTGTFNLIGNDFVVERGVVTIPPGGDMIPYIELKATTTIDPVTIIATIRGRATQPELVLSSIPAYPESEIFTMLVTGSSDTQSADPEKVKAQAASLLSALSSPALQRHINQAIGVDKIGVSFGDNLSQPIFKVGKNVSKNVYVETRYQANVPAHDRSTNDAELGARYRFKPNWSLETYFGNRASGGVDVYWGRSYDIKRHKWWLGPPKRRRKGQPNERAPAPAAPSGETSIEKTPSGKTSSEKPSSEKP